LSTRRHVCRLISTICPNSSRKEVREGKKWEKVLDNRGNIEGKINGIFAPVSLGAPPGTPPPERTISSGSPYLRLQVDSLTWSGTTSQSGCGVYSLACLPLAEVFSLLLYICTI